MTAINLTTVEANEPRAVGPHHDTWPASLPQVAYVTADGGFLCVTCANEHADFSREPDPQWHVIGAQLADHASECAHCYRTIPNGTGFAPAPSETRRPA